MQQNNNNFKMEKWIICDIDGTLLNNGVISQKTRDVLIKAQEKGYRLFLASGRSPYTMKYFVSNLKLDIYGGIGICFNGGIVYDFKENKILHSEYIEKEELKKCIQISQDAGLEVAVYTYDKIYVKKCNPKLTSGYYRNDEVYKYVTYIETEDLLKLDVEAQKIGVALYSEDEFYKLKEVVQQVDYVRVSKGWMEKSPRNVNKGKAILSLLQQFNQSSENIYCFGDGENDIEMFKVCGFPIAMENGFDSLKQYAKDITKSNLEDGVAYYVENYLLKKIH